MCTTYKATSAHVCNCHQIVAFGYAIMHSASDSIMSPEQPLPTAIFNENKVTKFKHILFPSGGKRIRRAKCYTSPLHEAKANVVFILQ